MTPVAGLDTPALVVDLEIMVRNLRRAADYTVAHGLRFRPNTKTHAIPSLAIRQLELGAVGLTVAKVGEAEVMLGAWPGDLLLEYPTIGYPRDSATPQECQKPSVAASTRLSR